MLFTRCPDCETTFRITADALRKADGQVRCGRCARVFNAYNELRRRARRTSAARREAAAAASAEALARAPGTVAADARAAAAESMQAEAAPAEAASAEAAGAAPGASHSSPLQKREPPPPSANDARDTAPLSNAAAAGEPGTARADAGSEDAAAPARPNAVGKTISRVKAARASSAVKGAEGEKDVVVDDISLAGVIAELEASAAPDDAEPVSAAKPKDAGVAPPAGKLLGKNGLSVAAAAAGEAARGSAADGASGDGLAAPAWVILDEAPTKRAAGSRAWAIGTMALGALLAIQIVHHYRSELAVAAVVGPAVRDAYAMLGVEIAPDWNLDQYEIVVDWDAVTQPSVDEQGHLKIAARIRNKGPGELPLPHVQVELKDRWESTLGSRVFAPAEYLPPGAALHRPMTAGQIALAELAILDPGPEAYGFELDVCVGSAAGGLRCAADEVFH